MLHLLVQGHRLGRGGEGVLRRPKIWFANENSNGNSSERRARSQCVTPSPCSPACPRDGPAQRCDDDSGRAWRRWWQSVAEEWAARYGGGGTATSPGGGDGDTKLGVVGCRGAQRRRELRVYKDLSGVAVDRRWAAVRLCGEAAGPSRPWVAGGAVSDVGGVEGERHLSQIRSWR
jgi:hypothetical protein